MSVGCYEAFLESCRGFSLGALEGVDERGEESEGEKLASAMKRQREGIESDAEEEENAWNEAVVTPERRELLINVKDNMMKLSAEKRLQTLLDQCTADSCGSCVVSVKPAGSEQPDAESVKQMTSAIKAFTDQLARISAQDHSQSAPTNPTDILDNVLRIPVSSLQ